MKIKITGLMWWIMAAVCLIAFWHTGDANFMPCVFICVATSHILYFIKKGEK